MASTKKKATCGRCGIGFVPKPGRYNSLCSVCLVPHMCMGPSGPTIWRCDYCGQVAPSMGQLQNTDCTHRYAPCKVCKQAPYCAKDCGAMTKALDDAGAYRIGF